VSDINEGKAMDINEAIETLEAAGFYLYRRLRQGNELCGAMMVHTETDLYLAVRLFDDGLCSYLSGECIASQGGLFVNFDELRAKLPMLLNQAERQRDTLSEYYGTQDAELDVRIPIQLKELKDQTGRALEPYWLGESGCMKGVYRGVILEINDSLRVIGFDDCVLRSDAANESSGLPLEEVFEQIDEAGGYEDERIEESAESQVSQYQAAVH
jgi:hypothetical protein